ncbi:hypothetical protein KKC1_09110 [Calderihabitans maritimus]|uniref:Uncharacterized protein n=1 Tax=Calderihabitans maritimus TaxID=1246530 RepID=A0A1Z5HR44_9FIRM|nr:hypothetical protein KKC1_09110 [Calderihabitans maritimus]
MENRSSDGLPGKGWFKAQENQGSGLPQPMFFCLIRAR